MKPPPKIGLLLAAALLLLAAAPCPAKEQGFTWFKESASGPDVARVVRFCREAHVRSRQGRVNQPAQALRQALVESQQNALVQLLLANAYAALNQPQAADDAQRQADAAPATIWDAELWATLLNERWMADDLRSALSRWPQNVTAHLGLALIEKSAKKYRRAAELGAFVAERQPHHPALRPLLAAIAPGLVQEAENALLEGNKPRAAGSARLILRLARAPSKDDLMWAVVRAHQLLFHSGAETQAEAAGKIAEAENGWRKAAGLRLYAPLVPGLLALASLACWAIVALPCLLAWLGLGLAQRGSRPKARVAQSAVSATGVGIVFLWSVALPASLGTALGALLSARIPLAFLCLLSPLGLVFALRAFLHHLRSALRVPEDAAHLAPLAAWRALALTSGIELLLSAVVAVALGLATLSIVGWQALSLQGGLWTWVASS